MSGWDGYMQIAVFVHTVDFNWCVVTGYILISECVTRPVHCHSSCLPSGMTTRSAGGRVHVSGHTGTPGQVQHGLL